MAESQPLRIVMAPKTKRAVALGLAVEAYGSFEGETEDRDGKTLRPYPADNTRNIVERAKVFLAFLEGEGD
jgi:hypothetical protein